MKTVVKNTREVDGRLSVAYWVDAICEVFVRLGCSPAATEASLFAGEITQRKIGALDASLVVASGQQVVRRSQDLQRDSEGYVLVNILSTGLGVGFQDGRVANLTPSSFIVCDSTRPFKLDFTSDFEQTILRIPRQVFPLTDEELGKITGLGIDGSRGAGRVFCDMARTLARDSELIEDRTVGAISTNIIEILALLAQSLGRTGTASAGGNQAFRQARIKEFLMKKLKHADLTVDDVAAALGISVSNIYRAFDSEGITVSRWLWKQRLQAVRHDLADPMKSHRHISDIAFEWGFNDSAHFSRSFRKVFGMTPSEFRALGEPR